MEKRALVVGAGIGTVLVLAVLKALYDMCTFRRSDEIDWNDPSTYHRLHER
jgi:hypothetical protein